MKALKLSRLAMVVGTAAILAVQVLGQGNTAQASAAVKRVIVVSLEDRKLALVEDDQVKKVYPVAVGKPSTPSPVGTFTIERRVVNPTYHHNGRTVLPGPGNPVGTRWMGLSIHGYGIHGTNEPNSIGKAASHGCIRMAKTDLEEFYELVSVGDTVELVGARNEETARVFGDGQNPAGQSTPVIQAAVAAVAATPVATAAPTLASDESGTEKAIPAVLVIAALSALR